MTRKLFAHSRRDGLLILVALAQLAVLAWGVLSFGAVPLGVSVAAGLASVFLMTTNFMCVSHNFIHNPFFVSKRLNALFGVFNSLLVGGPESIIRIYHLRHHKYNNDAPDPETGTTGDHTSTWRYGEWPEREEGIVSYALLTYFRTDVGDLVREAKRRQLFRRALFETAAVLASWAVLAALNPWGFVAFYLPVWYLGNAGAQAENYLEHHGAIPGDRKTDSVSSYGRFYNWIWFNNGYHQEHHFRPQVHWTRVPALREQLPPETERRVVVGAHWFNFGARRVARDTEPMVNPVPARVGQG
jgi:fatty acid desaturase